MWARQIKNHNLDDVFVFTHAPGSSAYSAVERRMAPFSKDTAVIILLLTNLVIIWIRQIKPLILMLKWKISKPLAKS